jgi:hypothetical protein
MDNSLDNDLYEIGMSQKGSGLGARRPSRSEAIEKGKGWLDSHKERICELIQGEQLNLIVKGGGHPHEEQVRIVADLIAAHFLGVPPFSLARAILVLGEKWFCDPKELPPA